MVWACDDRERGGGLFAGVISGVVVRMTRFDIGLRGGWFVCRWAVSLKMHQSSHVLVVAS